jgi:hypothetical protein
MACCVQAFNSIQINSIIMAPYDISTRALIVTLKAIGKANWEITCLTTIPVQTINLIYGRAITRGFDPAERPLQIKDSYLVDAPESSRPSRQQPTVSERVVDTVRTHRYERENSYANSTGGLSQGEFNVLATTIPLILPQVGFKKTKSTRKTPVLMKEMKRKISGLTKKMKKKRRRRN